MFALTSALAQNVLPPFCLNLGDHCFRGTHSEAEGLPLPDKSRDALDTASSRMRLGVLVHVLHRCAIHLVREGRSDISGWVLFF